MCGRAEPVSSSPGLRKAEPQASSVASSASASVVCITSSTPNFDQSSLGSDDSGICCSSSNLRLTRSAEFLDDDLMPFGDESKSLAAYSDEMMEPDNSCTTTANQSPLPLLLPPPLPEMLPHGDDRYEHTGFRLCLSFSSYF